MVFKNLKGDTKELGDTIHAYVENRLTYLKLDFFKKTMLGLTTLIKIIFISVLSLISFFFLSIALAIWLGDVWGNPSYGYLAVGGFYIVLVVLVLIYSKKIVEKIVLTKYAKLFFDEKVS